MHNKPQLEKLYNIHREREGKREKSAMQLLYPKAIITIHN